MEDKKLKLAEALRKEFDTLKNHPNFDTYKEEPEYDLAINYLLKGSHPKYYNDNDLLYGCIEDLEQMYLDYNID